MTSTERRRHNRRYKQTRFKVIVCGLIIFFGTLTIGNLNMILIQQTDTLNTLNAIQIELDKQSIDTEEENGYTGQIEAHTGTFTVTHYCACPKCCGKSADGITATGTKATEGRTVAVDPEVIPLGSQVEIDGHTYIAEDVGGAIKGNAIDIYCDSHSEAVSRGKIERTVRYERF